MNQLVQRNSPQVSDTVKICKRDLCIEAGGENGKLLAQAAATLLLVFAFSLLIKALR